MVQLCAVYRSFLNVFILCTPQMSAGTPRKQFYLRNAVFYTYGTYIKNSYVR